MKNNEENIITRTHFNSAQSEEEEVWIKLWEFANQSINTDGIITKDSFIDWGRKRFIVIEQK